MKTWRTRAWKPKPEKALDALMLSQITSCVVDLAHGVPGVPVFPAHQRQSAFHAANALAASSLISGTAPASSSIVPHCR